MSICASCCQPLVPGSDDRWPTHYRCPLCGRLEHHSLCVDPTEGQIDCVCGLDQLGRVCDKCWATDNDPTCYCVDAFTSTDDPDCSHCLGSGVCPHTKAAVA